MAIAATANSPATQLPSGVRDPRLDFYRGIAMFIIYISHTPNNWWGDWIPGRFGFSDATEIFVFCSGMASAIAFGRSFDNRGWWLGTARVGYRVWQIYWAHLALFFFCAMLLVSADTFGNFENNYVNGLNLGRFFTDTGPLLIGLFTLTYVPNFFDILPMYMVLLLLMPLVMLLARINLWIVAAFCLTIWFLAQSRLLDMLGLDILHISLPAEPWSDRPWFFNPFAWQLVFFTGFAFMRGWLPKPPINALWITVASGLLIAMFFVSHIAIREFSWSWSSDWRTANQAWISKTEIGAIRFLHFLSLAYIAWVVAGENGRRLIVTGTTTLHKAWAWIIRQCTKVGQQSLAVFLVSIALSRFSGFVLDLAGNGAWPVAAVNVLGCAFLLGIAYMAAWFKSQPWRKSATG
ncbi:hypothetical protein SAMN04488515_2946 [Cognatiyoonia koreensis]|uniref:OpgC protein n=1 Tax=Cognatiyoonia koreensis TaxID=364200 RepID=A0A1I0RLZ7_9RHOB|nr:OpgC domain-containing protein [Cognatiyoonia koreensis]SEW42272.1 hypothetical protein SAMN04488515_2946 [Cognatiyoonia koreensis]